MKEDMEMDGNWTFINCINKYSNYILYIPNKECNCSFIMKDNFKKSKIQIIEALTRSLEIKKNNNFIKIDEDNAKIVGNEKIVLNKVTDFYDIIIDIKSIKDIFEVWEVKMSEKALQDYKTLKEEKVIRIGVIGNANKGKSFLLSKLSQSDLPSGISIRTEGLSIKYPELEQK